MRKPTITTWVAVCALAVGSLSALGGVLEQRAASRKVCSDRIATNAAVRGLLDDFINADPGITKAERAQSDAFALRRFPDHC